MSVIDRARELRRVIEANAETMPDDLAIESSELFPAWREGTEYETGMRVRFGDVLYKALQAHRSQAYWTPDVSASLYAKVLIPDESVIPPWEQPNSTNAYGKGDKVTHNGRTWVSTLDDNSWEPGVYGWTEIE